MIRSEYMKKPLSLISLFFLVACSNPQNNKTDYFFQIINENKSFSITTRKDGVDVGKEGLKIETSYPFEETTYSSLPSFDMLDNEDNPYDYGTYANEQGLKIFNYFKVTFYIKNISQTDSSLNVKFNIYEDGKDNRLIDTVRLMIFENEANTDLHNYSIYAKQAAFNNIDKNGVSTNKEFMAVPSYNGQEDDEHPLVTGNLITDELERKNYYITSINESFKANEQLRYTVVLWLEGEDPDSNPNEQVPSNSNLKMSVEVY